MAFVDAINEIERLDFAVRIGMANSFRIFLRNISEDKAVKELLASGKSRDVGMKILDRIVSLSRLNVDVKYLNRFDIPLSAYLWVLSRTFPDLALAGAEVCAKLPRTWWAERLTDYILGEWAQKSTSATSGVVISAQSANADTSNVAAHTSVFLADSLSVSAPMKESVQVRLETTGTPSEVTETSNVQEDTAALLAFTTGNPHRSSAE